MDSDREILKTTIRREVQKYWSQHAAPILLSHLGSLDGGAVSNVAKRLAGSLKVFIELNLPNEVAIVQHSAVRQKVGAIPHEKAPSHQVEIDAIFDRAKAISDESRRIRIDPRVWRAFKTPIEAGKRRYVLLGEIVTVLDLENGSPPDAKEIVTNDLPEPQSSGDFLPSRIYAAIQAWCAKNEIQILDISFERTSGGSQMGRHTLDSKFDLLEAIFRRLSETDLQAISMPLSIVRKLRN